MKSSILKRITPVLPALLMCAAAGAAEVGVDNQLVLNTQGDNNVLALEQIGELNSLNLLIHAQNVRVDMLQQGNQNLIAGVYGAPDFVMAGHNNVVDIVQIGSNNQVFGMQLSANSMMSVTQYGSNNVATIIQR